MASTCREATSRYAGGAVVTQTGRHGGMTIRQRVVQVVAARCVSAAAPDTYLDIARLAADVAAEHPADATLGAEVRRLCGAYAHADVLARFRRDVRRAIDAAASPEVQS